LEEVLQVLQVDKQTKLQMLNLGALLVFAKELLTALVGAALARLFAAGATAGLDPIPGWA